MWSLGNFVSPLRPIIPLSAGQACNKSYPMQIEKPLGTRCALSIKIVLLRIGPEPSSPPKPSFSLHRPRIGGEGNPPSVPIPRRLGSTHLFFSEVIRRYQELWHQWNGTTKPLPVRAPNPVFYATSQARRVTNASSSSTARTTLTVTKGQTKTGTKGWCVWVLLDETTVT
jgi:hypothetical protein